MANRVYAVQGKRVYENGNALPSVVHPDDAYILNTALLDHRLEWEGRESLLENGQWMTRDQETQIVLHTSPSLSDTWLWINNWLVEPQGMCLEEKAQIVFPNGIVREGSVWQHTDGARGIYAAVAFDEGMSFFSLVPQWHIASHEGEPVYQGMTPLTK